MAVYGDEDPKANKTGDEAVLVEIRDRFKYAEDQNREIRNEAATDMQFVGGNPWDSADEKQRKNRPTVAPDEMHQYFNQVINGLRANPRGIKFSPVGGGASNKGADLYADKTREIEYRSHATLVYITAAENAIHQGFGWLRVNTKYDESPGRRFLQEVWLEDVPNPHMILPDPDAKRPDSSDMRYLFFFEAWDYKEFERTYPKAQVKSFDSNLARIAPGWMKEKNLLLAEYWKVKTIERELVELQGPAGPIELFADEANLPFDLKKPPPGLIITNRRPYDDQAVCQYLTNGVEILKYTEWAGKYIPFVSCYGKVIYVDQGDGARKMILSMTRHMRSPWKLYCYYRSQQAEMAGMIPKTPVQAYTGQLDRWKNEWEKAMHEPVAFLYFDGKTPATGEQILPPPSRLDYHAGEHLQSLELCAEGARRAIQAAAGSGFLPTQAQRRNEKSGVALKQIDDTAARGSFHFNDHYNDMIRQTGIIIENLIDKIYDSPRDLGVRKANDDSEVKRVNDPQAPGGELSTKGDYLVTVSTGPSTDNQREEASDFATELMQTPAAPLVMDLIVKLRNLGPVGDEIAERLTPPQFNKPKDGEPPTPEQLQQQVGQLTQENQQLKQILEEAKQLIQNKKLELDSKERIAAADQKTRREIADINARAGMAEQAMKNDAAHQLEIMQAQIESIQLLVEEQQAKLDRAHEAGMQAETMMHERAMGAQGQRDLLEQGERAHGQALEQGEAEHGRALEQAAQAAALAPPPTEGAGA